MQEILLAMEQYGQLLQTSCMKQLMKEVFSDPKSFKKTTLCLTRLLKLLQQNRAQEVTGVVSRSVPSLTCPR